MVEKNVPAYWDNIRVGDMITLKDEQTLHLLMEEGAGSFGNGVDLQVRSVRRITESNELLKWNIYELEPVRLGGVDLIWYFIVKIVDELFDLSVMYCPDDFSPGTRVDLLDAGCTWIFAPPDDEDDFDPDDLIFAQVIEQPLEDGTVIQYEQKKQGMLFGRMTQEPDEKEIPEFATVVEYMCTDECENPELLLWEVGGVVLPDFTDCQSEEEAEQLRQEALEASQGSGVIFFFQGGHVQVTDINVNGL